MLNEIPSIMCDSKAYKTLPSTVSDVTKLLDYYSITIYSKIVFIPRTLQYLIIFIETDNILVVPALMKSRIILLPKKLTGKKRDNKSTGSTKSS